MMSLSIITIIEYLGLIGLTIVAFLITILSRSRFTYHSLIREVAYFDMGKFTIHSQVVFDLLLQAVTTRQ